MWSYPIGINFYHHDSHRGFNISKYVIILEMGDFPFNLTHFDCFVAPLLQIKTRE